MPMPMPMHTYIRVVVDHSSSSKRCIADLYLTSMRVKVGLSPLIVGRIACREPDLFQVVYAWKIVLERAKSHHFLPLRGTMDP